MGPATRKAFHLNLHPISQEKKKEELLCLAELFFPFYISIPLVIIGFSLNTRIILFVGLGSIILWMFGGFLKIIISEYR